MKMIVVKVEDNDICTKLQVVDEGYAKVYDMALYKQSYNGEEWEDDEQAMTQYREELALLGGKIPAVGDEINAFPASNGKAYLTERTVAEKPDPKMVNRTFKNCVVKEFKDTAKGRTVLVEYKGHIYSFNFGTSVWIPSVGKYVPNDAKLQKARARFDDVFEFASGDWEHPDLLVGTKIDCLVQKNELDGGQTAWLKPLKVEPEEDEDLPF